MRDLYEISQLSKSELIDIILKARLSGSTRQQLELVAKEVHARVVWRAVQRGDLVIK